MFLILSQGYHGQVRSIQETCTGYNTEFLWPLIHKHFLVIGWVPSIIFPTDFLRTDTFDFRIHTSPHNHVLRNKDFCSLQLNLYSSRQWIVVLVHTMHRSWVLPYIIKQTCKILHTFILRHLLLVSSSTHWCSFFAQKRNMSRRRETVTMGKVTERDMGPFGMEIGKFEKKKFLYSKWKMVIGNWNVNQLRSVKSKSGFSFIISQNKRQLPPI